MKAILHLPEKLQRSMRRESVRQTKLYQTILTVTCLSRRARPTIGRAIMTTSSIWSEDIESILLEMNAVALPTAHEAEEGTDPNEGKSKCGGRAQPAPPSTTDGEADGDEDSGSSFEVPIPEEFVCPLTLNVMRDPVVSKWGHR
jgi:hypothetical protein